MPSPARLQTVLLSALVAGGALPSRAATLQLLGDLPGGAEQGVAFDVSADGSVVVGRSEGADGSRAFRWTAAEGLVSLGVLSGGTASAAHQVSDDGTVIVGQANTTLVNAYVGFRKIPTVANLQFIFNVASTNLSPTTSVDALSGDGSVLAGFHRNNTNDVRPFTWVAPSTFAEHPPMLEGTTRSQGQRWSWIYGLSTDGSIAVGASNSARAFGIVPVEAFVWNRTTDTRTGLGFLSATPRLGVSRANGVSGDGTRVVGYAFEGHREPGGTGTYPTVPPFPSDGEFPFLWTAAGGMRNLGSFGPYPDSFSKLFHRGAAHAISRDGNTVVGYSLDKTGVERAFVWTEASGLVNLDALVPRTGDLADWRLERANGVSADGRVIVGIARRISATDRVEQPFRVVLGGFAAWQLSRLPAALRDRPGANSALGDPDGDGLPQLLEYAIAGDPAAGDAAPIGLAEGDGAPTLSLRLRDDDAGLVFRLQAGPTPASLADVAVMRPLGAGLGFSVDAGGLAPASSVAEEGARRLGFVLPAPAEGRLLVRLAVEQQP